MKDNIANNGSNQNLINEIKEISNNTQNWKGQNLGTILYVKLLDLYNFKDEIGNSHYMKIKCCSLTLYLNFNAAWTKIY